MSQATESAPRSPLQLADFRVLAAASITSGMSYLGETVVLGWILLERSDSPLLVGVGIALRALPNLLVGLPGGALADGLDRRSLLRLTWTVSGLIALALSLLALSGVLEVWLLLALTFIGGSFRAVAMTARTSYVFDLLGARQVSSGLALLTLGQRLGGVVSSLVVGVVIATWGTGEAYLAIGACSLVAAALMFFAHTAGSSAPAARSPVLAGMSTFFSELRHNRLLGVLVGLTAAVEVLGFSFQALMPTLARDVLDAGAEGLGRLNAASAAGGIASMFALALLGQPQRQGLLFLLVLAGFGLALVVLGLSTSLVLALFAIALVSAFAALSDLMSQGLLQGAVGNELRGRAMGSWTFAVGLGPVGHLQIGALAVIGGATFALVLNGLLLAMLAALALLLAKQVRSI